MTRQRRRRAAELENGDTYLWGVYRVSQACQVTRAELERVVTYVCVAVAGYLRQIVER